MSKRMREGVRPLKGSRKRGSVLALTLLFLVLISLFAMAFWRLVPVELHSAKKQMLETEAYFASDGGIVDSLEFLRSVTAAGNVDNYFNSNGVINADGHRALTRTGTVNGWTWTAEIVPGPETFGHADNTAPNPLRVYQIVSTARRPGISGDSHQYRRVSAWVRQKTFADKNWALSEYSATAQPLWLFMDTFTLGGDYHTNGPGLLRIEDSDLWSNSGPAIQGDFSFHVPSNNPTLGYVDGVRYSSWGANNVPYWITAGPQQGEARGNRYEKISGNGKAGIKSTGRREMPLNTDSVSFGAWGGPPPTTALTNGQMPFGAASTVKAAINGAAPGGEAQNGIYIQGTVRQIEYRTTSNNPTDTNPADDNQIIRVYQSNSGANPYMEVTHVTGANFTIPNTATVVGSTHPPGTVLTPSANDGKGYTVIRNVIDTNGNGTISTAERESAQVVVYNGQTNGALFVAPTPGSPNTGDVLGVRGIVKGRRTIGVSTDTGNSTSKDQEIIVNGHITYAGTNPYDPDEEDRIPQSNESMLGLIGYAVRVKDDAGSSPSTAPTEANPKLGLMYPARNTFNKNNPLYIYASIFAGRRSDPAMSFSGDNPILQGGGFGSMSPGNASFGKGHMVVYGSITEGIRQWKGTGDTAGNHYEFKLDPNLEQIQPPFFPTLPDYDIIAWQEESVFSY